jgi:hypothetical protein
LVLSTQWIDAASARSASSNATAANLTTAPSVCRTRAAYSSTSISAISCALSALAAPSDTASEPGGAQFDCVNGCPSDSSRRPSAFSASTSTSRTDPVISSDPSEIDFPPRNHDIAIGGYPRTAIWSAGRPKESPSGPPHPFRAKPTQGLNTQYRLDMKLITLPLLAVDLLAGCSAERTTPAAPASTVTVTSATPSASVAAPTSAAPVTTTPTAPTPEADGPCTDDDLAVTNGPLESANTQRHVTLSFTNTSSHSCTLVGYPGADLVTPAGGVLINVPRRPANAAHHLTLNPGEIATADVAAYVIDTATGNACPRWLNLVVTAPNGFVSHQMSVDVPICNASVSSVD